MNLPHRHPVPRSEAIRSVGYVPLAPELKGQIPQYPDADGFVIITFGSGRSYAYLCEAWRYGLLLAGRSTGRAFHQLLRGKAPATRIA